MKLVKSLLLGSAAGLAAVAGAQAADLPFRKAAPVDYVRVCDWVSGGGYFYIPGTDTCLKVGGEVRFEYAYQDNQRAFQPNAAFTAGAAFPGFIAPPGVGPGAGDNRIASGTLFGNRAKNQSGFLGRGKIEVDVRTQTAYGLLRTNVRVEADRYSGNETAAYSPPGVGRGDSVSLDRGYITFAGITAGRVQSFFDFYADNYNYDGIANSDQSTQVLAYTATFGGGFSGTISVEDPNGARRDAIGNIGNNTPLVPAVVAVPALGVAAVAAVANPFASVGATYAGMRYPDAVAQVRYDAAWGAVQVSGAFHDVNTVGSTAATVGVGGGATGSFPGSSQAGFAVQAGLDLKLPMLAAGDELWLEGAYQEGAYLYQDSGGNLNSGFTGNYIGGFIHNDVDAVARPNGTGGYQLSLSRGFSVLGAIHHYFTPQFHDVLYGSYEEVGYGNAVRGVDWRLGGIGDGNQYKIGNQFIFTPVHNLDIGVDVMYAKVSQDIPETNAAGAVVTNSGAAKAYFRSIGVDPNPDLFEVRLRLNRDF